MYTKDVKNITLSADTDLIERARLKAAQEKTTLNSLFRSWLERYAGHNLTAAEYRQLMQRLRHASPNRAFTRDELNER